MIDAKQANRDTKMNQVRYLKKKIKEIERAVQDCIKDKLFIYHSDSCFSHAEIVAIRDHFKGLGYSCTLGERMSIHSIRLSWKEEDI